ncbi:MAG: LysR family transcriptional regulator [Caldibacillus sp.]
MDYNDWKILASLYETHNITKAAKKLFLTQPTVTARIKKLEEYYGVPIIIRKQRGITFTPEGEVLARHARRMLVEQRMLEEKLIDMRYEVKGTLRVGVSNFFALNKMPKLLSLFKKRYPDIECQVVSGWSSEMYRKIVNHDVHIAIIKGDFPWKEKRYLLYEEEICVASPWPFRWEDLPALPRIDYLTDANMRQLIDEWWYANYTENPYVNIHVNSVETCREMIVNGLGYGIVANLVVKPYANLYVKTITDHNYRPLTRKTWMYYHTKSLELNIVTAFVSFIKKIDVKAL